MSDMSEIEGWSFSDLLEEAASPLSIDELVDGEIAWDDEAEEEEEEQEEEEQELLLEVEEALEEEEKDSFFTGPRFGRRAMANRARRAHAGRRLYSEAHEEGYLQGAMDALKHVGMDDEQAEQVYSGLGLFKALGRGVVKIGKRVVAPTIKGAAGVSMESDASEFFYALGAGVGGGIGVPALGASVEAGKVEAPPVYVADEIGAREDLVATRDVLGDGLDELGPVKEELRFSSAVTYGRGFVGRQGRIGAKKGAGKALRIGSGKLSSVKAGNPVPMIEDPGAHPLLLSDGRVLDAVYGELCTVPCPSCSSVHHKKARYGGCDSCAICRGNAAILVPERDLAEYKGCVSYGAILIPLLVSGALSAGSSAFDRGAIFPEASSRFKDWKEEQGSLAAERIKELREGGDVFAGVVNTCLVGALVPTSLWEALEEDDDLDDDSDIEELESMLLGEEDDLDSDDDIEELEMLLLEDDGE